MTRERVLVIVEAAALEDPLREVGVRTVRAAERALAPPAPTAETESLLIVTRWREKMSALESLVKANRHAECWIWATLPCEYSDATVRRVAA